MVLILNDHEVERAVSMDDAVRLVEDGLRQYAVGGAVVLPRLSLDLPGDGGAFRVMAASLPEMGTFGLKTLTGYPGRRRPGETYFAILLFSSEDGALRAIMAGRHLTGLRTGAATGVAAKYLAKRSASCLGIFGAGAQSSYQVAGVLAVRPVRLVKVYDVVGEKAEEFARAIESDFGVEARRAKTPLETVQNSDLVITVTTSRQPAFRGEWLEEGAHATGVGSNSPAKQELDAVTFRRSKIVVDFRDQVLQEAGDLRHAIETGTIGAADIHAELGEIITGKKIGRASDAEITLFKSVGVAVEDIATAAFVYERARERGLGLEISLEGEARKQPVAVREEKAL